MNTNNDKNNDKKIKAEDHHYIKMFFVIAAAILFFVLISNIGTVRTVIDKILAVLSPIVVGLCLAFIFNLPLRFLEEKIFGKLTRGDSKVWAKLKRPVCLLLSFLFVISILTALLSFVIPEFIDTCKKFFAALPAAMVELNASINAMLTHFHLEGAESNFTIDWSMVSKWALDIINSNQSQITQGAIGIVTSVFTTLFNFILGFVLSIYILASKESLGRLLKSLIYSIMKRERAKKLISLVVLSNKAFSGFVAGQCTEVLLIGVLCFIGMLIFQMPYAIMVSCIIAVTAFIPVFGPFIGTGIGAFLILVESPIKALWFVIFIVILQQLESNIIYPRIMGKHVGLPGIWVLIAVTIGSGLFGMMGIIVSVPICSVLYTLFDKWIKQRLEERNICHRSMSHDSSEPKNLIDEIKQYEFEDDYADDYDDLEDDVYTDDGEIRHKYYKNIKENISKHLHMFGGKNANGETDAESTDDGKNPEKSSDSENE